jgi:ketosteroid isomerase-like protein
VATFIAAEARLDPAAETLLAAGADFIVTGRRREARPRLAAMIAPAEADVEEMKTQLAGELAWVVVLYRVTGRAPEDPQRARATFVLHRHGAAWRIAHAHSSQVPGWDIR